jgi:glutathione peroxidase
MSASLYDIPLTRIDGSETSLKSYEGDVLLIVNTASKCGLTPQYAGLEKAYEAYREKGFQVLGFPCNQFAGQEPGTEAEIEGFCQTQFGVQFPMFAKLEVNGAERHPLYAALTSAQPLAEALPDSKMRDKLAQHGMLPQAAGDILWNFEKFLIGRDGTVIGRFAPDMPVEAEPLTGAIETALGA